MRLISDMSKARFEETEKINKYNIDTISQEIVKLSKETYYELD